MHTGTHTQAISGIPVLQEEGYDSLPAFLTPRSMTAL